MNDISEAIIELLKKIRERFPDDNLEPLPGKNWEDCIQIESGLIILHYHIAGDKSSKAAHIGG